MIDPVNRSVKKNSIQLKIGFIMILAVILLTATCYLLYRNLSSIVSSIRIDDNPELRLLSIREISTDIEKAGNSVRIYTITKNPKDIKPYYTFISSIDEKVNRLRSECNNDSVLLAQTDTISNLIEENILIWNELLVLYKDDNVIGNLRQLSEQLDSASLTLKKQGILKRVFSRSTNTQPVEQEIAANLNDIVEQNQATRDELAAQESQLARNSSEISEKFYDLITKMENEINETIQAKAAAAGEIADKTYRWLILLAISGGLLAILVLYIIIRYARNAYSYQIALENSKDEAEKLAKTKELFMANMSHEIRTPVTAISGFTEQLLHESFAENTTRSLKIIKSSSDHLMKIIDDILDFSKLQNNKLVLEKVHFSISNILGDVFALFERQAQQNNTQLTYSLSEDTPPVLLGDPYRLKQIIINLVSNSVKFTKNGAVDFAVSSVRKQAEEIDLVLQFKDTGIGIDESKLNMIFEDFTQAEMSTTRKFGGTGLGLSIVKKLVELQHGTIDIKSRKNQGTEIVCRIPFMAGDEKQIKQDTVPSISVPEEILKLKILLVDDEEYNRLLFKKILDRWNIKCHEVANGMDALEVLKEERYDLLFMDIRMPGIDGIKTAQFIRDEMKISESDMPIVFISAAPRNEEWEKYRKAGMNAFLQKPFTEEMLLTTILAVTENNAHIEIAYTGDNGINKPGSPGKINLNNLYHISGGDEQFVKQMLISFINTTKKGLKDMKEAVISEQWESVANLAHKLSSPCRHIGATDLYNLLGKIEKDIRNSVSTESVETLAGESIREFEIISDLVNEHIAKMN
jgi:signal transduction histidine kinase/HPt (histidine-containing phosphotransfer) domain-containing protein/ActR/RegA family two-component response regulator